MIKISSKLLSVVPGLFLLACGADPQDKNMNQEKPAVEASVNAAADVNGETGAGASRADLEAQSSVYLDDVVNSAGTPTTPTDQPTDSVKEDLKAARIKAAAGRLLAQLDNDGSKTLSKDEFLAILKTVGDKCKALTPEKLVEVTKKFEDAFNAAKGTDEFLDAVELEVVLKAQGIRIGKFRDHAGQGAQAERVKKTFEDILAEFDKDGNGQLNKEEFDALRAAMKVSVQSSHQGQGVAKDAPKPADAVIVLGAPAA